MSHQLDHHRQYFRFFGGMYVCIVLCLSHPLFHKHHFHKFIFIDGEDALLCTQGEKEEGEGHSLSEWEKNKRNYEVST